MGNDEGGMAPTSSSEVIAAKRNGVEDALWLVLRTLREQAEDLEKLATADAKRGWTRRAPT